MNMIQKVLTILLRPFTDSLDEWDIDKKMFILKALFFLVALLTWCNKIVGIGSIRYLWLTLMGCILIFLIMILIIPKQLSSIKVNKFLISSWIMMSALMMASALFYRIDNLLLPFLFLSVFPVLWVVLINRYRLCEIIECLSIGLVYSFIIFFTISFILAPITIYQYTGIFSNPNLTSQYVTAIIPCLFYLVNIKNKKKYLVYLGMAFALMLYTKSRTGILAMLAIFLIWIVSEIISNFSRKKILKLGKSVIAILLLTVIIFPCCYGVNRLAVHTIQEKISVNAWQEEMEKREQTVDDITEDPFYYLIGFLFVRISSERVAGEGGLRSYAGANRYSSGRLEIWRAYCNEINLTGHGASNGDFSKKHSTAHNAFLEVAYNYGVVVGVLYLINIFAVSIIVLLKAFKTKTNEKWFSVMIVAGHGITAMLASITFPFTYLITFLFLFVMFDAVGGLRENEFKEELI